VEELGLADSEGYSDMESPAFEAGVVLLEVLDIVLLRG